ncbi:MAG TPA: alpha/beta hydrolase, partial [Thermoanaerobaculia bacterium]|nr:alpha/beta hydrolase [Thermoanaerobaculia bacterium]
EGSLIAMLAAQKVPVAAVVSIAGAGRPAGDLLLEQLAGVPPALLEDARRIIAELTAGRTVGQVPAELQTLFRPSVQPYLISWFRYDPAAEAAKLEMPLLVIQGTTDVQVAVADAERLARASGKARLFIIDGMNHILKDVPPDADAQVRSYSDPALPLSPTLANAIRSFVVPSLRRRAVTR